jgi:prepilin-type N-terminal cleavage/methylation domain-containing protein
MKPRQRGRSRGIGKLVCPWLLASRKIPRASEYACPCHPAIRLRAFTLIEMLLATTLAAILMGGVLVAAGAVSRDRLRMASREAKAHSGQMLEVVRRDLANGMALVGLMNGDGFEIMGCGAIDPRTLLPNQRLARVRYRVARQGRGAGVLVREQAYLDDPIRPDRWNEVVAVNVTRVAVTPLSGDGEAVRIGEDVSERLRAVDGGAAIVQGTRVASRVRVRIEMTNGVVDGEMVLR